MRARSAKRASGKVKRRKRKQRQKLSRTPSLRISAQALRDLVLEITALIGDLVHEAAQRLEPWAGQEFDRSATDLFLRAHAASERSGSSPRNRRSGDVASVGPEPQNLPRVTVVRRAPGPSRRAR